MIPIKYNLRNLRARWVNTVMTVVGTGMVVWASCILFGLVEGLQYSLNVSGDPLDLIVLRKGSTGETTGGFAATKADQVVTIPGIRRDDTGAPLVAKELVNIPIAVRNDGGRTNIIMRGISGASRQLRPDFKIVAGRDLETGKGEAIVSQSLSRRFQGAKLGGTLKVGEKESYRVVGLFTAGGSSAESEVWVDINDLERNINRTGYVSSVQLRAASAAELDSIKKTIDDDAQFRLLAQRETEYYANQSQSTLFLKGAGTMIAVLLTVGAMFAAANTMYSAVSARTREIGTMRALGFPRSDILISFLGESVILCTLGGILGLLATLPLSTLSFGTSLNFTETSLSFRFGPLVMVVAFLMTVAMGVFGGLFPQSVLFVST